MRALLKITDSVVVIAGRKLGAGWPSFAVPLCPWCTIWRCPSG